MRIRVTITVALWGNIADRFIPAPLISPVDRHQKIYLRNEEKLKLYKVLHVFSNSTHLGIDGQHFEVELEYEGDKPNVGDILVLRDDLSPLIIKRT